MYIPYPIQVVAKNTRYIIVVIIGIFFSRVKKSKERKLPKSKFVIAVVITLGAVMFMLASSVCYVLCRKKKQKNILWIRIKLGSDIS